jgi:hypothetical protein
MFREEANRMPEAKLSLFIYFNNSDGDYQKIINSQAYGQAGQEGWFT